MLGALRDYRSLDDMSQAWWGHRSLDCMLGALRGYRSLDDVTSVAGSQVTGLYVRSVAGLGVARSLFYDKRCETTYKEMTFSNSFSKTKILRFQLSRWSFGRASSSTVGGRGSLPDIPGRFTDWYPSALPGAWPCVVSARTGWPRVSAL